MHGKKRLYMEPNSLNKIFEYRQGNLYWKVSPEAKRKAGDLAGYRDKQGYIQIQFEKQRYLAHRLIYLMHHGNLPDVVDHIDMDSTNNRIENLRASDKQLNQVNSNTSRGISGLRGVTLTKEGRFKAVILKDRKKYHIGHYDTAEEAHKAYLKKRDEMYPGVVITGDLK